MLFWSASFFSFLFCLLFAFLEMEISYDKNMQTRKNNKCETAAIQNIFFIMYKIYSGSVLVVCWVFTSIFFSFLTLTIL